MAIVDAPQSLKVHGKLRSCFGILVFRFGWVGEVGVFLSRDGLDNCE
jgi:hypothetical protein